MSEYRGTFDWYLDYQEKKRCREKKKEIK